MNENMPLLSICIPTYNRDKMLDKCLSALYNIQEHNHNFNLIIGDNGSEDFTSEIITKWESKFNNIKLVSHPQTIGYDRNVASLYSIVQTEYCWFLGDCDTISEQDFVKIENHLPDGYDVVVINSEPGRLGNEKKVYNDIETFIDEQGWHVTKLSSCVVNRKLLEPKFMKRYFDSHFVQWGNLMESLCQKDSINVFFDPTIHLGYLEDIGNYRQSQKGGWRSMPFTVWGRYWTELILSLPMKIPYELKLKVIKDHERQFHWFSIRNLLKNKIAYGKSYIENYKENRKFVKMVTVASPFWSDVVMYLPIESIYGALRFIKRLLKKKH